MKRAVAVVGAGPAGIATLSRLLDLKIPSKIHWIDTEFKGGRLKYYPQVPSNTAVSLFLGYLQMSPTLNAIYERYKDKNPLLIKMSRMDPKKGCDLVYAAQLCHWITDELLSEYPIQKHIGKLNKVEMGKSMNLFVNESKLSVDELHLCTGSHPILFPQNQPHKHFNVQLLDLEHCLSPDYLKDFKPNQTVVVVGSSHSAILCLMNLSMLPNAPRIINVYRQPLKYAVYYPDYILYDNTGLKQLAADWAKEWLEDPAKCKLKNIERIQVNPKTEAQIYQQVLPQANHIVYAIGYERNSLPLIEKQGESMSVTGYDVKTGHLQLNNEQVENIRGFGIAFPRQVVDPMGNIEYAVGMYKFQKHVQDAL